MAKCPACKVAGYKRKKFTEDAFDLCGIKYTKLSYFKTNCTSCGHNEIDVKSLDKSRKDLMKIIVSCELSAINRTTISFLLKHLFDDSLFVISKDTGIPALYIKDVLKASRPLTDELSNRVLEASFLKLCMPKPITFIIED